MVSDETVRLVPETAFIVSNSVIGEIMICLPDLF